MKTFAYLFIAVFGSLLLSNTKPCKGIINFFFGENSYESMYDQMYITSDAGFAYNGKLGDTLIDPHFNRYKLLYPKRSTEICRVSPINIREFWNWGDYLTKPYWSLKHIPIDAHAYRDLSVSFTRKFKPYYGAMPPVTADDSLKLRDIYW